jgi:threonyl-tRNA synthetase
MAEAVQELWPGTQVTIGPVIDNGFFYDFAKDEPFTPGRSAEDRKAHEGDHRSATSRSPGKSGRATRRRKFLQAKGELYKVELVDAIRPRGRT